MLTQGRDSRNKTRSPASGGGGSGGATTDAGDVTMFSEDADTLQHEEPGDDDDDEMATLLRNRKSTSAKSAPPEPQTQIPQNTYFGGLPPVTILILAAEFGERFCYYGISSVYVLYMMQLLDFNTSTINGVTNAFSFVSYTTVLLGGWIADRQWGRRLTIVVFGGFYILGLIILTLSASPLGFASFPTNPTWAVAGLGLGLSLISLGTGGIKSNVSPLMADQLGPDAKDQDIERAFQYFYWSINLGSLFGMFISPLLQRVGGPWTPPPPPSSSSSPKSSWLKSGTIINNALCYTNSTSTTYDSGYYVSFALCTLLFIMAVACFFNGWKWYVVYEPAGSVVSKAFRLCRRARRGRLHEGGSFWSSPPGRDHWLWWSLSDPALKTASQQNDIPHDSLIRDLSQTLGVLNVFLVFPIYWLLYLQMSNTFVLQATMMYLPSGITADQISAFDPLFLVILIPIFDLYVFPWMRTHTKLGPIKRMTIGFLLNASCMFVAGGLQAAIDNTGTFESCSGVVTFFPGINNINVFAQVPQYLLLAVSEMFASVASLDYAYSRAPKSMKSLVMSFSLFQMAIGSALGLALTPIVLPQNFMWLFFSMGLIMVFFAGLFYVWFRTTDDEE